MPDGYYGVVSLKLYNLVILTPPFTGFVTSGKLRNPLSLRFYLEISILNKSTQRVVIMVA